MDRGVDLLSGQGLTYLLILALVLTQQGEVVELLRYVWMVLAQHLVATDRITGVVSHRAGIYLRHITHDTLLSQHLFHNS